MGSYSDRWRPVTKQEDSCRPNKIRATANHINRLINAINLLMNGINQLINAIN